MQTNILELRRQIQVATMLLPAQRAALITCLPRLNDQQSQQLSYLMTSADETSTMTMHHLIAVAAQSGDTAFFRAFDTLMSGSIRKIRKAEEAAEHGDEEQMTDRIFED